MCERLKGAKEAKGHQDLSKSTCNFSCRQSFVYGLPPVYLVSWYHIRAR